MEEKEKKNEAESETPKEETKSRREFLKSAAIQGAVAALFGAVTFDSVMARAMERVSENQSIHEIGTGAADYLHSQGVIKPMDYSCAAYPFYFDCSVATHPICSGNFTCDGYNCAGGGESFWCQVNYGEFICDVFTCNNNYECKAGAVECQYRYVC